MAVRLLEGRLEAAHLGPAIQLVEPGNVDRLELEASLAPAWFTPTFTVD